MVNNGNPKHPQSYHAALAHTSGVAGVPGQPVQKPGAVREIAIWQSRNRWFVDACLPARRSLASAHPTQDFPAVLFSNPGMGNPHGSLLAILRFQVHRIVVERHISQNPDAGPFDLEGV